MIAFLLSAESSWITGQIAIPGCIPGVIRTQGAPTAHEGH